MSHFIWNYMYGSNKKLESDTEADSYKDKDIVIYDSRFDPSLRLSQPTYKNFDIGDYLVENSGLLIGHDDEKNFFIKTQCQYMIKFEQVHGTLIMKRNKMCFKGDQKN